MKNINRLFIVFALGVMGCVPIPNKRVLASPVHGRLLMHGIPVANVKAIREVTASNTTGEKRLQQASTDSEGRFVWDELTTIGLVKSLGTWAYTYRFLAEIDGKEILFWYGNKTDHFSFGELGDANYPGFPTGRAFFEKRGEALYFSCELSDRPEVPRK